MRWHTLTKRQSPRSRTIYSSPYCRSILLTIAVANVAVGADWAQWRGPLGNGHAVDAISEAGKMPPLEFGENKNVVWRTNIPGRGHGSPTIVADRIYLATANERQHTQSVLCVDRKTGKILWNTPVYTVKALPNVHNKNTHASPTVACDGELVFATFYSAQKIRIACLSIDGIEIWKKDLAKFRPKYPFGYAASPLMYKDTVIATAESELENCLVALRKSDGKEVWRSPRPINSSYSSPALMQIDGRAQLVICGGREIRAYDAATGKDLWKAAGAAKHTAGTVVGDGNYILASGGYPQSETTCIRANGSGKVAWKNKQKCYEQSMLVSKGHVYAVNDNGVAYCWDVATGDEKWKKRLSGPISASPVLVGDRIYACNEKGKIFIFRASPDGYEELARNQLGNELFPTPTFLDGQIFARVAFQGATRQEVLFCFEDQ